MVEHRTHHRRRQKSGGNSLSFYRLQESRGIELALQVHSAATKLISQLHPLAASVEQRIGDQDAITLINCSIHTERQTRQNLAAMAMHHSLRATGSATRVDDKCGVVGLRP